MSILTVKKMREKSGRVASLARSFFVVPTHVLSAISQWKELSLVFTPADKTLILLLSLAIVVALFPHYTTERGRQLSVHPAANPMHLLSLAEHQVLTVIGPLGESRIEIGARGARLAASPCPHQVCVRRGWISRRGEVAVCLPNRLIIKIMGAASDVDAVVR